MKYKQASEYMTQQIALAGKMATEPATVTRTIFVHYTPTELNDFAKTNNKVFHTLATREKSMFGATFKLNTNKNNVCHHWKCLRYPKG